MKLSTIWNNRDNSQKAILKYPVFSIGSSCSRDCPGAPPGLVDDKLSEAGLYKLLSLMRMGNPNWFTQISEATDTGLLRELFMLQAFRFEIARKNNELLDRLTVIASMDYLTRMEGTTGKELEDLYTRMAGARQQEIQLYVYHLLKRSECAPVR